MKQLILYMIRWQLSTPILAIVMILIPYNDILKAIIANLIGSLIFFWIDKYLIFKKEKQPKLKGE